MGVKQKKINLPIGRDRIFKIEKKLFNTPDRERVQKKLFQQRLSVEIKLLQLREEFLAHSHRFLWKNQIDPTKDMIMKVITMVKPHSEF